MTDETVIQDRPMTRRDLAEMGVNAINRDRAAAVPVSAVAGGVMFADALQVMEFGKMLSVAQQAIPPAFRNNPGMCVAVVFQAVEWRMSPLSVINKSYVVNDRIGYESQLVHAVIEARAPLQKRLDCHYDGEGPTRTCTVIGHFTDGETREYTSPQIQNIKPQNSPLWKNDPDQQLWYFASRSWARKWCPDVLMGIYTREELADNQALGREVADGTPSTLSSRLGANVSRIEGHRPGHIESELDTIATVGDLPKTENAVTVDPTTELEANKPTRAASKKKPAADQSQDSARHAGANGSDDGGQPLEELPVPTNAAEYKAYAIRWFMLMQSVPDLKKRWKDEIKLRNACGVTAEQKAEIEVFRDHREEQLS